jgi:hypothetical protein
LARGGGWQTPVAAENEIFADHRTSMLGAGLYYYTDVWGTHERYVGTETYIIRNTCRDRE